MKVTIDTTNRGLQASVLPAGTTGRFFTVLIRPVDESARVEIDATAEGLGALVVAVLEQLDDAQVAELLVNELGHVGALDVAQALIRVAEARQATSEVPS